MYICKRTFQKSINSINKLLSTLTINSLLCFTHSSSTFSQQTCIKSKSLIFVQERNTICLLHLLTVFLWSMSKHDWVAIFRLLISQLLASCSDFHSYNMKGMQCFYPIGHPSRKTTVINKYKIVELKQMSLVLNVQFTKERR